MEPCEGSHGVSSSAPASRGRAPPVLASGQGQGTQRDGSGGGGRLRGGDGGTAGSGEASVPVPAPSCPSADRLRLDGPVTTDFRPLTRLGWHLTPVALSRGRKPWLSQHRGSPSPDCKDRDLKRGHARGRHRSLRAEIARLSDAALTGHDIPGFLEMPDAGRGGRRGGCCRPQGSERLYLGGS